MVPQLIDALIQAGGSFLKIGCRHSREGQGPRFCPSGLTGVQFLTENAGEDTCVLTENAGEAPMLGAPSHATTSGQYCSALGAYR